MSGVKDKALALIDVKSMRGLEVGPLHRPRVSKADGSISYIDHLSTAALRNKYDGNDAMQPFLDQIVEVDYVHDGKRALFEVVGENAPFDYLIASHLIEHIPNVVGWLAEVAEVLAVGGVLSLVIPDKRYSFDINRPETEIREIVDAHLRDLTVPSYAQLYDFFSRVVTINGIVDTAALWAREIDYAGVVRADVEDPDVAAYEACLGQRKSGEYIDVHCGVYTPSSFLQLFGALARLGLVDFKIAAFFPTEVNTLEFFVSLEKLPTYPSETRKRQVQLESIPELIEPIHPKFVHDEQETIPDASLSALSMDVSHREQLAILWKRRIIERMRRVRRRT